MNKYQGFRDLAHIKEEFDSNCDDITDQEIIFASYGRGPCYDGDAFILIHRGNTLYTAEAAHCSCYGLEGGWDMVPTTIEALKMRDFDKGYHPELIDFMKTFLDTSNP